MDRKPDEIGAYEAKTHLAQLLRRVAAGERFMITQRGKPVAELGPVHASRDRDAAEAAREMKAFRRKHPPIADVDIRALQEEGRD
jgi:prevent-host-death family protein